MKYRTIEVSGEVKMKSEIMFERTSLTNSNDRDSLCPFCLAVVEVPEKNDFATNSPYDIFEKFVIFSKVFLKENSGEKLFLARALNRPLPRFCENCEEKVKEILELHRELEKLKYKLMLKVVTVGEAITKSQKTTEGWPSNTGLLQVFRKQVARKCQLKARRILPKVIVRKTEGIGVFSVIPNELQDKTVKSKASQMEIQCLIGLIVIHSSIYGWNLSAISEAFPAFKSTAAFERVTADSRTVMIPTRATLHTFTFLLLMYFIAYDWSLEKITLQNSENTAAPPPQRRIIKRKRGRPPGTRVKIEGSSKVIAVDAPPPPLTTVVKRGPGRPPRTDKKNFLRIKKKGRPGRPRKISTNNIKTELLDRPKRGPGRPKRIKLQDEQNDNDALVDRRETEIRPVASLPVEKTEVEIPSPEASMIGLSFQDENDDNYAEDYISPEKSPLPQDVNMAPMDIASDGNTKELDNQNEASTLISEETAANDPPPQQNEASNSTNETERIKRKRGRPFKITPSKAEIESRITSPSPTMKRRPGRPKKKKRGRPPRRQNLEHPMKSERSTRKRGFSKIAGHFRSIAYRSQIASIPNPAGIDLSQRFSIRCTFPGCRINFKTLFPFLEHLQIEHSNTAAHTKENPPSCESCRETFTSHLSLMEHLEKDHEKSDEEDASHFCFYCHRSFCTKQLAELHRKNIHWLYPQQVPCEVENCSEEFTCTRQLTEHYKTSHGQSDDTSSSDSPKNAADLKLFSCEQCHWPFLSKRRLRLHRFNHVTPHEKEEGYQCTSCQNRYITTMKLSGHFNHYHHSSAKYKLKFWNCGIGICDFFFFSEKEVKAHKKLHEQYTLHSRNVNKKPKTDLIERISVHPIVCIYCLENFPTKAVRNVHEDTCPSAASPEERLKIGKLCVCGKCSYATDHRSRMHQHSKSHSEKKYQCPECGDKFYRTDHLQQHIKRKHRGPENKLVCHLCGVKRSSESDMKYHMSEHERRHLCPDCGQKFTRAWLLSVHMRKHTGERIQCEWCPAFYRTVPELKEHYQSRHPEELEKTHGSKSKIRVKYKLVKKDKATSYRQVPNVSEEVAEESGQSQRECSSMETLSSGEGEGGDNGQEENQTELNHGASASLDSEMVHDHSMQQ